MVVHHPALPNDVVRADETLVDIVHVEELLRDGLGEEHPRPPLALFELLPGAEVVGRVAPHQWGRIGRVGFDEG